MENVDFLGKFVWNLGAQVKNIMWKLLMQVTLTGRKMTDIGNLKVFEANKTGEKVHTVSGIVEKPKEFHEIPSSQ